MEVLSSAPSESGDFLRSKCTILSLTVLLYLLADIAAGSPPPTSFSSTRSHNLVHASWRRSMGMSAMIIPSRWSELQHEGAVASFEVGRCAPGLRVMQKRLVMSLRGGETGDREGRKVTDGDDLKVDGDSQADFMDLSEGDLKEDDEDEDEDEDEEYEDDLPDEEEKEKFIKQMVDEAIMKGTAPGMTREEVDSMARNAWGQFKVKKDGSGEEVEEVPEEIQDPPHWRAANRVCNHPDVIALKARLKAVRGGPDEASWHDFCQAVRDGEQEVTTSLITAGSYSIQFLDTPSPLA